MPRSSLVEVEVGLRLRLELRLGLRLDELRCKLDLTLVFGSTFTGGWLGGRKIGE